MEIRCKLVLLALPYVLVGCGGNGAHDCFTNNPSPSCNVSFPHESPPPSNNESPLGLWVGEIATDNEPGVTHDFFGIIAPGRQGEFRFFTLEPRLHFVGELAINGNQVTGSGAAWTATGVRWTGGVNINAELIEKQSFIGTWSAGSSDSGTMSLLYDATYERPPALSKMEANWFATDGAYSVTISIDGIGVITGSDTNGCILSGSTGIWPHGVNIYTLNFDVTSCGSSNGYYGGFATVVDGAVQDDTLIASVKNETSAMVFVLSR